MAANLITLIRLILVFVAVGLFGDNFYVNLAMVALTAIVIWMDALDGYIARKLKISSDFGALFDIVGDRIVENVYWIFFAVVGIIPFWFPMIVLARGFITDSLRSVAFAQGKTPFGSKTMMKSKWTQFLVSSRFSRGFYGISKTVIFIYLGAFLTLKSAMVQFSLLITPNIVAIFGFAGFFLALIVVAMCLIRGFPVLVDGWAYIRGNPQPQVELTA